MTRQRSFAPLDSHFIGLSINFYCVHYKSNKIQDYINALSQYGTTLGEPYIKKLNDDIWELRPLQDRILFAAWIGNNFLLLSQFVKKTKKTPIGEINKAKRLLKEYRERRKDSEQRI